MDRKTHWEGIYSTKGPKEVSWYQAVPLVSLHLLSEAGLSTGAYVIDVGGGDSYLADYLVERTSYHLSVLDISFTAIERAKARLGEKSSEVEWIVSDLLDYHPVKQFDFWHDRAVFHFLTDPADVKAYVELASSAVLPGGYLLVATFSSTGPLKCSGIEVSRYSIADLTRTFSPAFELVNGLNADHTTPFDTTQNFTFCLFRRVIG